MNKAEKKQYVKPRLSAHGSVEEITGWIGGGSGEFFGGVQGRSWVAFRRNSPADFGS